MRTRTTTTLLATAAMAGALTLTGCVNPVDGIVDKVLEGQGVDIDENGGTLTIEGEDGGSVVIGGTEVPSDFPAELPLPARDPVTALNSSSSMAVTYDGLTLEEVESLSERIDAVGYERASDFTSGSSIMRTWENDEWTISLIWSGSEDSSTLIYGATPKNP